MSSPTSTVPAIAVVIGSTRPGRKGDAVARWVLEQAFSRTDASFEVVDLLDVGLPALDEPVPPAAGRYSQVHTQSWADTVARFDGYVFVTPEYNHGYPGSLKNALDRVYAEWNHKAAGFVAYGADGGVRAVEQLWQVVATLKIADVAPQVAVSLRDDFTGYTDFTPRGGCPEFRGTWVAIRGGRYAAAPTVSGAWAEVSGWAWRCSAATRSGICLKP